MRILGISDHYLSGAALIRDGRVISAVNEERLVRKKMVMGFPRKSIEAVLRLGNVQTTVGNHEVMLRIDIPEDRGRHG